MGWIEYRDYLRKGCRIFDTAPSLLQPRDKGFSYLPIADLEAAFELLVGPLPQWALPQCRR